MLSTAVAAILATAAHSAERTSTDVEAVTVFGQRIGSALSEPATTGSRLGLTSLETPASIEVIDLHDSECIEMMAKFIRENPRLWNEDIGVD